MMVFQASRRLRPISSASLVHRAFSSRPLQDHDVCIVSFARTPVGKINGSLASLSGPQLGAVAMKEAVKRAGIKPEDVEEVYMGNVVSAGLGQAPARQATIFAGLPKKTVCTTVNKVCASGMKTVMLAAQSIMVGQRDVVVAGGFESMSNVPYYLSKARSGYRLGHGQLIDGIVHDGLWDVYYNQHMGMCAEKCAADYAISREDQDAYAVASYTRVKEAVAGGRFDQEIIPVTLEGRKGGVVSADEQHTAIDLKKLPTLRPVFKREGGTVTAANASSLNDGGAALVVMSGKAVKRLGVTPLARILGFGDAEQDPVDYTTAPSLAVPQALRHAKVTAHDMDYHEVNEAFSVVALANMKLLGLVHEAVNVNGGAVGLGHPIGMSGARIVMSLISVLQQKDGTLGSASICNGGGGASAMVIERLK